MLLVGPLAASPPGSPKLFVKVVGGGYVWVNPDPRLLIPAQLRPDKGFVISFLLYVSNQVAMLPNLHS